MPLYQCKQLADLSAVGEPGPLPADLQGGLTDADLERLGLIPSVAPQYAGLGFFRVADPAPAAPTRWLDKAIVFQRIPADKRIAIRAAARPGSETYDPVIEDFLDLIRQTREVDLDNANLVAGLSYLVGQGCLTADDVAAIRA
jgi:hypothetical protein